MRARGLKRNYVPEAPHGNDAGGFSYALQRSSQTRRNFFLLSQVESGREDAGNEKVWRISGKKVQKVPRQKIEGSSKAAKLNMPSKGANGERRDISNLRIHYIDVKRKSTLPLAL